MTDVLWLLASLSLTFFFLFRAWRERQACKMKLGLLSDQIAAVMERIEARKRPNWVADKWR